MKQFFRGFVYAVAGIKTAVLTERNLRFHLCAGAYVLLASAFYPFGRVEYALLLVCIGGVIALELVNSAIERAVDAPDAAHWQTAGQAKDMAAGAVLAFCIAAACIGLCLFWQKQPFLMMVHWFLSRPLAIFALALSFVGAAAFVSLPNQKG